MAALDVAKSGAGAFWSGVAAGSHTLGAGIDRLWLDGKVSHNLDHSGPQIGGPAAWARSLTGAGVTIAVLDTGVDTAHPGLTGRIAATRGFTPAGPDDVQDWVGHGTHVSTTAAGSGAGSPAGAHRGIAPAADLAVGKVLDDFGSGQDSWVLAGMEWAATEVNADVVNLSLGGADLQGDDPCCGRTPWVADHQAWVRIVVQDRRLPDQIDHDSAARGLAHYAHPAYFHPITRPPGAMEWTARTAPDST